MISQRPGATSESDSSEHNDETNEEDNNSDTNPVTERRDDITEVGSRRVSTLAPHAGIGI